MSVAALVSWSATVLVGLLLLVIWLMEYDRDYQSASATRLPLPVISAHALCGVGGLMLWGLYLVGDEQRLAWATVAALGTAALLGLIMAARWIGVVRTSPNPRSPQAAAVTVPPERHFPIPVVVTHGILAVTTLGMVLFTVVFTS
jgi:hypothetical protein